MSNDHREWFIFGEYPDGRVDISDGEHDVHEGIGRAEAEKLIAARNYLVREKSRIGHEEGERASKDWSQFFPGLARLEIRCLCATLLALEHVKKP